MQEYIGSVPDIGVHSSIQICYVDA